MIKIYYYIIQILFHIRETFHRFCKAFDSFIGVPMLNSVSYAMFNMTFEHDLTGFMKSGFCRVYLGKNRMEYPRQSFCLLPVLDRLFFSVFDADCRRPYIVSQQSLRIRDIRIISKFNFAVKIERRRWKIKSQKDGLLMTGY